MTNDNSTCRDGVLDLTQGLNLDNNVSPGCEIKWIINGKAQMTNTIK